MEGQSQSHIYYGLIHSFLCHFHIVILKYLSMKELRCLCRQTYSRHCAGMLDSQLETGFSQIPRRRLHPTALPPILPSFHSASRRPTIRPHTRPYGFYHLSIELSLVKAFNTWGFGTHSKYLSCHLDSFSILQNWLPFFSPTGGPARRLQKTGSSFCLLLYLRPWMAPSLTVPLCLQTTVGNCSNLA